MKKTIQNQTIESLAASLRNMQSCLDYASIYGQYQDKKFSLDELINMAVDLSSTKNSGPFGALLAYKQDDIYKILSLGTNLVVANNNSMLHAETVALINFLQQNPQQNRVPDNALLISSCEPCSQCRSFFLALGGHPDNIISVLTKAEAATFGGFADDNLYELVKAPISARKISVNSDVNLLSNQFAFVTASNLKFFEIGDSFINSIIKSYYDYTRSKDVSFESSGTQLIINQLPQELSEPQNNSLLRLFFSVVDWAKLTLQIQDPSSLESFKDIVLYTKEEISSGQFVTDKKDAAGAIMQQWKLQAELSGSSYAQVDNENGNS